MKLKTTLLALATSAVFATSAHAAIEIQEEQFGPTYGTMVADAAVGKPAQLAQAVLGTATYIVSFPFSVVAESTDLSFEKLVVEPWNNMGRCVGCSEAYDNYRNSQNIGANEVRFTVDGPSEIIINSDRNVVVSPR